MIGHERAAMPSAVAGTLKKHDVQEDVRREKVRDKSDRATSEQVLDDRTRLVIFKFIKSGYFAQINGCISTGKEANVYFCENRALAGDPASKSNHAQLALKIFKTSILVFKVSSGNTLQRELLYLGSDTPCQDRDKYVAGEFRFRRGYAKSNPRKMVKMWAEKEFRNLLRLRRGGVRAPEPVVVRAHLLLMEFLGVDGWPSPRLKDAQLSPARLAKCYRQLLLDMRTMYHQCRLVHADLSEYNILYHQKQLFIIDVSQSVEHDHPHAMEFLRSDCANVTRFFARAGLVPLRFRELFEFVCAPALPEGAEPAAHLELLVAAAAARPSMTEEELSDESVFRQIFIPRTLGDVADPEKEALKPAEAKEYLGATGIETREGASDEDDDEQEEDEEEDDVSGAKSGGGPAVSPADAARRAALLCAAHLPLPPAARLLVARRVWDTREDAAWLALVRRLGRPTREEAKAEQKAHRARVKEERRAARKTKIPKKVKKVSVLSRAWWCCLQSGCRRPFATRRPRRRNENSVFCDSREGLCDMSSIEQNGKTLEAMLLLMEGALFFSCGLLVSYAAFPEVKTQTARLLKMEVRPFVPLRWRPHPTRTVPLEFFFVLTVGSGRRICGRLSTTRTSRRYALTVWPSVFALTGFFSTWR